MQSIFFRITANCLYSAYTILSWKSPLYSSCHVSGNHGLSGGACKSVSSCCLIGLEESYNEFASKCKGTSYLMLMVFQSIVLLIPLGAGSWRQIFSRISLLSSPCPDSTQAGTVCSAPGPSKPVGQLSVASKTSHRYLMLANKRRVFLFPWYSDFPQSYSMG